MSVDNGNAPANGGNTSGETPPATGGFQPITSQDDLNRIISERVTRERAKYADYGELKTRAGQADELVKSAEEKAKEAEAALAGVPAQVTAALRTHLVSLHQIGDEDAELFLTASDPETLVKQVQRLTGRTTSNGNVVPREGTPTPAGGDGTREFARSLFAGE